MMQHDDDEGDDNFNDASFLTIIRQLDLFEGISTEVQELVKCSLLWIFK